MSDAVSMGNPRWRTGAGFTAEALRIEDEPSPFREMATDSRGKQGRDRVADLPILVQA